ncbi:type II toxin-antitoxin system Phd/YefM family antitoxin [Rhizobium leguminosarum]|uniref:type II toxin-antitoxin system prevent-host-death family antitoxin n=1 Tax=Rhizobium leguminosarum TaxID=384 RepID=UPI001C939ADC|nr:type II toxin-antitoxin system prevent-host-death family antitoxin [Rhizobium leguminosarum]MBY5358748.1 type II toxin-antitoxin system Phd/YefM family antitoxin [Rhizobium leguminosarum]
MQTIRSINLQKNLGDVLKAADVEAVLVTNREQPRAVLMSAEEFIRLKTAAGEPIPSEVRKSRPTLYRRPADPLGYDTHDPSYAMQMAEDALNGRHSEEIEQEIDRAMRRWGKR